jgi:hypothetical protein
MWRMISRSSSVTSLRPRMSAKACARSLNPIMARCGPIHHKTLERKARGSEIPGYQIAGRWYFRASELDSWLRSQLISVSQSVRVN